MQTPENSLYFVLFSPSSHLDSVGLRPQLAVYPLAHILEQAEMEILELGHTFRDYSDVQWRMNEEGGYVPTLHLTPLELLEVSVRKLSDRERLYQIFPTTAEGGLAFVRAAAEYGLEDKARALAQRVAQQVARQKAAPPGR